MLHWPGEWYQSLCLLFSYQVSLETLCAPSTAMSGILLGTQQTVILDSTGVGRGGQQTV